MSIKRYFRQVIRWISGRQKPVSWGNDEEIGGGGGYDFTMKTALYVARIIHHDIVYAGARSWQWWRSIGGDYKDGLIREYSDPTFLNGEVKDSKLMWLWETTVDLYARELFGKQL